MKPFVLLEPRTAVSLLENDSAGPELYYIYIIHEYVCHSTVVLQSDVPTTDLSKNGKFQKRSDEWAGKPAGGYEPIRAVQSRCLLDPVPRTHPIKSPTIWSLSLTSSRTAGRLRQITTSPVSLKYFISRKQAVRFPPDPPASFGRVLNYVSA